MCLRSILPILFILFYSLHISAQNTSEKCNCCSEQHRQFDFWLGEWEVYANEKIAGSNVISVRQDSCLIKEDWVSSNGNFTGTSYNFYNKQKKQWQQIWIDNQGGNLELSGNFMNGKMVMTGEEMTNEKGEKYINRITWIPNPDGSVRQLWQSSKDKGKSWNTVFDGLYKRKKLSQKP